MNDSPGTPHPAAGNGGPPVEGGQESKKYIRTFASDLEMAEKKGVAPTPPPTPPPPAPVPTPPPSLPLQPPHPPPPQTVPQEKSQPLETYAGDFSDRMKKVQASTATILAAEQDSLPPPPHITLPEPSRISLSYVAVGSILVVLSVAGVFVAYFRLTATQPVAPPVPIPAPILVDERETLSDTGPALLRAVVMSANRPISTGTIRLLLIASSTGTSTLFAALPLSAPDILLRNLKAEGSMTGIISVAGDQSPFFILSISAYGNAFSAMLAWEPLMPAYLAELFPSFAALTPSPAQSTSSPATDATTSVATSTPLADSEQVSSPQATTSKPLPEAAIPATPTFEGAFVDVSVSNHDVRIYRDALRRDVFLYGFWNQTTLIIARSPAAFSAIVERLATSRTL